MGCKECGKPKCNGECGCKSPKVLQINNPAEYITFHKVSIPAAMGDSTTNPPKIGAYRNALVYYEADHTSWMYSTDGIPTLVTGEQGPTGPQGPAGTITIGTTTTGETGSDAEVENVGTPENAILNFTIPRGEQGEQGIQGEPGPQGYMNEQDVRDVVDTIVPEDFFTGDATDSDCGDSFELENLIAERPVAVEIKGNSSQDHYSGKNLWEYSVDNWVFSSGEASYSIADSVLTVTTAIAGTYKNVAFKLNLPAGTYTFSLGNVVNSNPSMTTKRMTLATRNNDGTGRALVQHIDMGTPKTITLSSLVGKYYTLEFWGTYATSLTNTAVYSSVQIEAGSGATTYEKFVGGAPSPSPLYPQPIESVTGKQTLSINNTDYEIDLGSNTLSYVPGARDKIVKDGNYWLLKKEVGALTRDLAVSAILGNTADPTIASADGAFLIHRDNVSDYANTLGVAVMSRNLGVYTTESVANNAEAATMTDGTFTQRSGTNDRVYFRNSEYAGKTGVEVRAMLLDNGGGANYYYPLSTPEETTILDSNLISQLNAIQMETGANSIAVSSDGLVPEICLEAYLDNWNGNIESINERVDSLESSDLQNDILGFHSVAGSSATYILQFPNGKNMIVDSGQAVQWPAIKTAIDGLGITKFDYVVTTHFHGDHFGNNVNLINNYDLSDCQWFVQSKPDFANHSAQIEESEAAYDNRISDLTSRGITPIVPEDFSTVTVDSERGIVMKFFNTDPDVIENYYTRYTEYREPQKINFNDFSLMVEVSYGENRILLTGDIERPVEDAYHQYMRKATIMTAPHHGVNTDANRQFYYAVSPEASICSFVTTSPTWIQNYYKGFRYLKETTKLIVTAYDSKPDDLGMFSFDLTGKTMISYVKDGGIDFDSPFFTDNNYTHARSLVEATIDNLTTLTLKDYVNRLPIGAEADIPWYSDLNSLLPQIRSDISAIFPISPNATDFVMHIVRSTTYIIFRLLPSYSNNDVWYELRCSTTVWNTHDTDALKTRLSGGGRLTNVDGETNFVDRLNSLPTGSYWFSYKDTTGSVLNNNGYYEVRVDLTRESATRTTALLTGSLRDTISSHSDACVMGFFDSIRTTPVRWYNVTNAS